jgi:hypothetical protein
MRAGKQGTGVLGLEFRALSRLALPMMASQVGLMLLAVVETLILTFQRGLVLSVILGLPLAVLWRRGRSRCTTSCPFSLALRSWRDDIFWSHLFLFALAITAHLWG